MVFNVCNGILGNCEVYRLTFDGYRQISKCFKNAETRHSTCESSIFYETAPYRFENLPLKVSDFNTDESIEEMDVEVQSGKHEFGKESIINDNLDHKDMDGLSHTLVACQICKKKNFRYLIASEKIILL